MNLHTHIHRAPRAFSIRESRMLWFAGEEQPYDKLAQDLLGDLSPAESRESIPNIQGEINRMTEKLVGWEKLPKEKRADILRQITEKISRDPNLIRDKEELQKLGASFQKLLVQLGYAKEVPDLKGKGTRYEHTPDSHAVSSLLSENETIIRPDGTKLTRVNQMRVGDDGSVTLTDGQKFKSASELMQTMRNASSGFRAVDIDFVQDRLRAKIQLLNRESHYVLKKRLDQEQNHQIAVERAQGGKRGNAGMRTTALMNIGQNIGGIQRSMDLNKQVRRGLFENIKAAQELKKERMTDPVESRAMLNRAAKKYRDFMTGPAGARIAREEKLEIKPGMETVVVKRPEHTRKMTEQQYAADFRERTYEEVNLRAEKILRTQRKELAVKADAIRSMMHREKWSGIDDRVQIITDKEFGDTPLISIADGRAYIMLHAAFYNPDTQEIIATDHIEKERIPKNGVALASTLAWRVVDRTVEVDDVRRGLLTLDEAQAITRIRSILDEGNPSPQFIAEQVKHMNERNQNEQSDAREKRPVRLLDFPYKTLTVECAAELGKFQGERLYFSKLTNISEGALNLLLTSFDGTDKQLWFDSLPILRRPDLAKVLARFQGEIVLNGLEDEPYNDSYRAAVEALSKTLRIIERDDDGTSVYNIQGFHERVYKEMEELKARRGEMDYHLGEADEGLPMPRSGIEASGDSLLEPQNDEERAASALRTSPTTKVTPSTASAPASPVVSKESSSPIPATSEPENAKEKKEKTKTRAEKRMEEALKRDIALEFVETPLRDIIDYLKDSRRIPIVLDKESLQEVDVPLDRPMTIEIKQGIPFHSVLSNLLNPYNLKYRVKDGTIEITSSIKAEQEGWKIEQEEEELSFVEEEIVERLKSEWKRTDLDFNEVPLSDIRDFIADYLGINILIDYEGLREKNIDSDTPISITKENVLGTEALHSLLQPLGLEYALNHDVLWITTKERIASGAAKNKFKVR